MPVPANAHLDFGYPWWLSYGHLPVVVGAVSILLVGYLRKWSKWPMLLLGRFRSLVQRCISSGALRLRRQWATFIADAKLSPFRRGASARYRGGYR